MSAIGKVLILLSVSLALVVGQSIDGVTGVDTTAAPPAPEISTDTTAVLESSTSTILSTTTAPEYCGQTWCNNYCYQKYGSLSAGGRCTITTTSTSSNGVVYVSRGCNIACKVLRTTTTTSTSTTEPITTVSEGETTETDFSTAGTTESSIQSTASVSSGIPTDSSTEASTPSTYESTMSATAATPETTVTTQPESSMTISSDAPTPSTEVSTVIISATPLETAIPTEEEIPTTIQSAASVSTDTLTTSTTITEMEITSSATETTTTTGATTALPQTAKESTSTTTSSTTVSQTGRTSKPTTPAIATSTKLMGGALCNSVGGKSENQCKFVCQQTFGATFVNYVCARGACICVYAHVAPATTEKTIQGIGERRLLDVIAGVETALFA